MLNAGIVCPGLRAACTIIVELQYKHAGYNKQAMSLISETLLSSAACLGAYYIGAVRGDKLTGSAEGVLHTIKRDGKEAENALRRTGECIVTGKYGNVALQYDAAECYIRMRAKLLPHASHLDDAAVRVSEFAIPAMKVMSELMFPVQKWVMDANVSYVPVEHGRKEHGDDC